MKATRTFLLILTLSIIVLSCEKDDPFYQVNAFETALHNNVSDYRVSQDKSALVWFPDIFIEAREQSIAWKNSGDVESGFYERLGKIQDNWAPENFEVITFRLIDGEADTTHARIVVDWWINDSAYNEILLDDFIQSGAGIAENADTIYIVHFFMKVVQQ